MRKIKLGVNSVLFQGHDLGTAMTMIALAGYDGIELSAIKGMCEHLDPEQWQEQAGSIRDLAAKHHLELLSIEAATQDGERLEKTFAAAAALRIPVVNIGPGGKKDADGDLERQAGLIAGLCERAAAHGVTLCVKAHVGQSVDNTPTTKRLMQAVTSDAFGIDMDPSHIYRAGENPAEALPAVLARVKHIHIRDCKGRGPKPGEPRDQACGRGDIDLIGYCRAMVRGNYAGPVCLEVIGAGDYDLAQRVAIAAESYGYLNACLKSLGAR